MEVIKRDGKKEVFDSEKINVAVMRAGGSAQLASVISSTVVHSLHPVHEANIYSIQKLVENALMNHDKEIARNYIEYRSERDRIREKKQSLTTAIESLINKTDKDTMNENANKDAALMSTGRDLLAGVVAKHFARNYLLPPNIVKAHDEGLLHYHDMDYTPFSPMTNCCLVDIESMFKDGFSMGAASIEKPKSISVAVAVLAQITAQVASAQFGK